MICFASFEELRVIVAFATNNTQMASLSDVLSILPVHLSFDPTIPPNFDGTEEFIQQYGDEVLDAFFVEEQGVQVINPIAAPFLTNAKSNQLLLYLFMLIPFEQGVTQSEALPRASQRHLALLNFILNFSKPSFLIFFLEDIKRQIDKEKLMTYNIIFHYIDKHFPDKVNWADWKAKFIYGFVDCYIAFPNSLGANISILQSVFEILVRHYLDGPTQLKEILINRFDVVKEHLYVDLLRQLGFTENEIPTDEDNSLPLLLSQRYFDGRNVNIIYIENTMFNNDPAKMEELLNCFRNSQFFAVELANGEFLSFLELNEENIWQIEMVHENGDVTRFDRNIELEFKANSTPMGWKLFVCEEGHGTFLKFGPNSVEVESTLKQQLRCPPIKKPYSVHLVFPQ